MAPDSRDPLEGAVPFSGRLEKGTAPFEAKGTVPVSQQRETGTAPFLSAVDLEFAYPGGSPVLRGLALEARRGRLLAILGPNGSGKSTLLRVLVGLLRPARGQVRLDGAALHDLPPAQLARQVGYVPQETLAVGGFTVLETVLMGRSPHTGALGFESPDDWSAAREAMSLTEVQAFADRSLDELSGGERQRVIIARALAQQPSLILLDEPTAFLDIRHQHAIYGLLVRLVREQAKTVVCVSHDLNLAATYSDDLVLLDHGHVAAAGRPQDVLRSEVLSPVYEMPVEVRLDESTGRPYVFPRPDHH
jgi:iron complex transport system ATP-binding protein